MDVKKLSSDLKKVEKEAEMLLKRRLPVIIGRMAKDHYQDNFRLGGFVDGGLHKWPVTRRQASGTPGASGQYGPLLSRRNHLLSSIKYTPADFRVTVSNDLPYAAIHNQGGVTHPTVTPRMRRFAWAMYHKRQAKGKGEQSPEANFWRGLALTKKTKLTIKIPKRRFIGESAELNRRIRERIENELSQLLNQ